MKFQSILVILIIILLLQCGEVPGEYRLVQQCLIKKFMVVRGCSKMGFYLFWWVLMFGLYLLNSILFLQPSFSHLICYFNYSFANSSALFKFKKGKFDTFSLS